MGPGSKRQQKAYRNWQENLHTIVTSFSLYKQLSVSIMKMQIIIFMFKLLIWLVSVTWNGELGPLEKANTHSLLKTEMFHTSPLLFFLFSFLYISAFLPNSFYLISNATWTCQWHGSWVFFKISVTAKLDY